MMKIGDLVSWADEDYVQKPWYYDAWRDIGVVTEEFDQDTVYVYWINGQKFLVWKIELQLLSSNVPVPNLEN